MAIDLAQLLSNGYSEIVPNAKYTTAAGVNAADVPVDLSGYDKNQRALLVVHNEDTTAATSLTIKHGATSATATTTLGAGYITDPATGDALALDTLDNETLQVVAINLQYCYRYLTVLAATDPTTSNGACISVMFYGVKNKID